MKYKLPVTIERIGDNEYMARSEVVRATASGDSPEEAVENLKEAVEGMIEEYDAELVFKDLDKDVHYSIVEVGV